ncbi:MAG: contractile injection system tape measure protein [Bacteroidota bacterium]
MTDRQHIIRRVALELELPFSHRKAYVVQEKLKGQVLEALNSVFMHMSSIKREGIIRIPQLVIDLGDVSMADFQQQLAKRCASQLQACLSTGEVQASPVPDGRISKNRTLQQLGKEDRHIEILLHFLLHASFPWWANNLPWDSWETILKDLLASDRSGKKYTLRICQMLMEHPAAQRRLFEQFSPQFLQTIWTTIRPQGHASPARLAKSLLSETAKTERIATFMKDVRRFLNIDEKGLSAQKMACQEDGVQNKRTSKTKDEQIQVEPKTEAFLQHLPPGFQKERGERIRKEKRQVNKSQTDREEVNSERPDNAHHTQQEDENPFSPLLTRTSSSLHAFTKSTPNSGTLWRIPDSRKKESTHEFGYYLSNAGLALILNCVPLLWQELGYLGPDRLFVSPECQERAIHLLQFMGTGETAFSEHELVLNKLVCGFPIEDPIRRSVDLTVFETESAETFLQQLIDEWGALKQTSPNGLRHNFLIRNGKLSEKHNHWLLQVEKAGYDPFLLNRLPWTLSIVKCRWMPKRLQVEWI